MFLLFDMSAQYVLWIFAEFECLSLKLSKLNHFLRSVSIESNHRPMSLIQSKRKYRTVDHQKKLLIDSYVIFWVLIHLKNDRCCLHFWQWQSLLFAFLAMTQKQQHISRWTKRWVSPDSRLFCPSSLSLFACRPPSLLRHFSWQLGRVLGQRRVRSGFLMCFCCSFSRTLSPTTGACRLGDERWIRSGRDRENRAGLGQRGRRQQCRTVSGSRHARKVHLLLFLYSFYSPLLLTRLLSGCLFFRRM